MIADSYTAKKGLDNVANAINNIAIEMGNDQKQKQELVQAKALFYGVLTNLARAVLVKVSNSKGW